MTIWGGVSLAMLNDIPQSQVGAIVHEIIENWQEERRLNSGEGWESLPQLAEFLFTGETRLNYFHHLHIKSMSEERGEEHIEGWGSLVKSLWPEVMNLQEDDSWNKIMEIREMPEAEKISLVKNSLMRTKNDSK